MADPAGAGTVATDAVDLSDSADDPEDAPDMAGAGTESPEIAGEPAEDALPDDDPAVPGADAQAARVPPAGVLPDPAEPAVTAAAMQGAAARPDVGPPAIDPAAMVPGAVSRTATTSGEAALTASAPPVALAHARGPERPGQTGAPPQLPLSFALSATPPGDSATLRRFVAEAPAPATGMPIPAQPPVAAVQMAASTPAGLELSFAAEGTIPAEEMKLARAESSFALAAATEPAASGRPAATEAAQVHQPAPRALALQIGAALGRATDGSIDLSLHPKELGRLRLSLSPTEQGLVVTVSADRPETLDLMRRHAADLGQDLRAMGFRDVDLNFAGAGPDHFRGQTARAGRDDMRVPDAPSAAAEPAPLRPATMVAATGLDIRL